MAIYRKETKGPTGRPVNTFWVGCDQPGLKACPEEIPFDTAPGTVPAPSLERIKETGWQKTGGDAPRYFCPKHRLVSKAERDSDRMARFMQTRIAPAAADAYVPTVRVWDEFCRYVGSDINDPEYPFTKRDIYAAVRALGAEDGVRGLTIDGKGTSTPVFKGVSLKTTTEPAGHDEWFAKRKGGVLAKKRTTRAAELEYHRDRAERRRARQRQEPSGPQLLRRFIGEVARDAPGERVSADELHSAFQQWLIAKGHGEWLSKRQMMGQLRGQGLKPRRTSHRREDGRPVSLMVYDDISIPGGMSPGQPPRGDIADDDPEKPIRVQKGALLGCSSWACMETARTKVAGDLGWVREDSEVFCLGHAEDHRRDLVEAAWPKPVPVDLDAPGPRGREDGFRPLLVIPESDLIFDEDLPGAQPPPRHQQTPEELEAAIAAFEAEPDDAGHIPEDDLEYID